MFVESSMRGIRVDAFQALCSRVITLRPFHRMRLHTYISSQRKPTSSRANNLKLLNIQPNLTVVRHVFLAFFLEHCIASRWRSQCPRTPTTTRQNKATAITRETHSHPGTPNITTPIATSAQRAQPPTPLQTAPPPPSPHQHHSLLHHPLSP